jgi:hypothetical protein
VFRFIDDPLFEEVYIHVRPIIFPLQASQDVPELIILANSAHNHRRGNINAGTGMETQGVPPAVF